MASSINPEAVAMSVRIQEIMLTAPIKEEEKPFCPTLRVGWLSNEFSVFSHWKRVRLIEDKESGKLIWKLGWKSSLVKWVDKSTEKIAVVLFQKVGETESPVAVREIPCQPIIMGNANQKYKFSHLPLQELKGDVQGVLSGWVRCDEESEESSEFQRADPNGMRVEKASTLSHSTTFTQPSVDMSIDLTMEMPREYYPFISDADVFKTVFLKHLMTLKKNQWILGVILEYKNKIQVGVPLPEECPPDIFIELGMYKIIAQSESIDARDELAIWQASPRTVDFDALEEAAKEMLDTLLESNSNF